MIIKSTFTFTRRPRSYRTDLERRLTARDRRHLAAELGLCLNGPLDPQRRVGKRGGVEHGPVVRGGRCERCLAAKKRSH